MATAAPARRYQRDDGYGRSSRFYDLPDGLRLPSVTTILQAAPAKPALINWAARTERDMVIRSSADLYEDLPVQKMNRAAYVNTLESRIGKTKAHAKELAKASEIGAQAHARIEWILRKELKQAVGPEPILSDKALWAVMAWEDWRRTANLAPIAIEQAIWSVRHGFAGTLDLLCELDLPDGGRGKVVVDWKSSKGIWPEMALQNAAYVEAVIEMGHAPPHTHGLIVRLPKIESDPAFEVKWYLPQDRKRHFDAFLACLAVWRWQESQ